MCNCAFFTVQSDELLQTEEAAQNNWTSCVLRTPDVMEEKDGTYVLLSLLSVRVLCQSF